MVHDVDGRTIEVEYKMLLTFKQDPGKSARSSYARITENGPRGPRKLHANHRKWPRRSAMSHPRKSLERSC